MDNRVKWVDITKFLGIFAIYLGHLGSTVGNGYLFVFQYHVALFFLISGCMSNYDTENNIKNFIIKKIKRIMVPLWIFALLSIIVNVLYNNIQISGVKDMLLLVLKGCIRNTFFSSSLWFLSCLFLMEIIYKLLKLLKNKWIISTICLLMFILAEKVISPRPIVTPHWLYNLDSVFYYMIFYNIGYVIYPHVVSLFERDTLSKKIIFIITGVASGIYSVLLFFKKDYIMPMLNMIPVVSIFTPIFRAIILIWFNLIISKLLENIRLFNEIGRNTLYLCGNEYIWKTFVSSFFGLLGFGISISTPLHGYLYTMLLLIIGVKVLVPLEKKLLFAIQKCWSVRYKQH